MWSPVLWWLWWTKTLFPLLGNALLMIVSENKRRWWSGEGRDEASGICKRCFVRGESAPLCEWRWTTYLSWRLSGFVPLVTCVWSLQTALRSSAPYLRVIISIFVQRPGSKDVPPKHSGPNQLGGGHKECQVITALFPLINEIGSYRPSSDEALNSKTTEFFRFKWR